MTKYGAPWGVEPASNTLAMAGWSIRAKAWRSDSKRAITSRRVHPGFDQLQRHAAAHGLLLLGQPDLAHAAFSDFLQQVIAADHRPDVFTLFHARGGSHAEFGGATCSARVEVFLRSHVSKSPFGAGTLLKSIHPIGRFTVWIPGSRSPEKYGALF